MTDLPALDGSQLPRDRAVSYAELVDAFLRRRSANTMKGYRRDLESFRAWLGVQTTEEAAEALVGGGQGRANRLVLAWKQHLGEQGFAASTVNRRLAAVRSMVDMANVLGIVPWSLKVKNVPAQAYRDTRGPGWEGVQKLLAVLDGREDTLKTRRDRALLYVLFGLALRRFEAVAIDTDDVDFKENRIRIRGKGRAEDEYVTMSKPVARALAEWIMVRGDSPGALFVSLDPAGRGDGRLTGKSVHRIVRKLGEECGLKVWPHGLRHAAITEALDATHSNIRAVARFSRHKSIQTVMTYDDNRQDLGGQVADLVSRRLEEAGLADEDDEEGDAA